MREWPKLSNVEIGRICAVSESLVRTERGNIVSNEVEETRIGADGKERTLPKSPSARPVSALDEPSRKPPRAHHVDRRRVGTVAGNSNLRMRSAPPVGSLNHFAQASDAALPRRRAGEARAKFGDGQERLPTEYFAPPISFYTRFLYSLPILEPKRERRGNHDPRKPLDFIGWDEV